jgi:hypothetical protein
MSRERPLVRTRENGHGAILPRKAFGSNTKFQYGRVRLTGD